MSTRRKIEDHEMTAMQHIAYELATVTLAGRRRMWHYFESRLDSLPVIVAAGGGAAPEPTMFDEAPEVEMPEVFGAGKRSRNGGDE